MQTLKSSKTFRTILIVILFLAIVANIAISFAYFTDKVTIPSTTLQFGTIKIQTNKDNWFSTIKTKSYILKPGDKAVDSVSIALGNDSNGNTSQPFYVRAKCTISTVSTNTEVLKVKESLTNALPNSLESTSAYKWSSLDDGYFYLLGSNDQPLAISSSSTTYYFIKSTGLVVPTDLEIDGTKVNSDEISITISVEAIQEANVVADSGKTLQAKIKDELNALVGVS